MRWLPSLICSGAFAIAEFGDRCGQFRMILGIDIERNIGDGGPPCLLHGAHAGGRPPGMTDDPAAAKIEKVGRAPGAPIGLRSLPAPLSRAGYGKRAVSGVEKRRADCLEGFHEAFVRLPV